jgi:hypothetical protein
MTPRHPPEGRTWAAGAAARVAATTVAAVAAAAGSAAAHGGALAANQEPVSVPLWLFLLTGGGVVAGSFLFTSLVTDREFIRDVHDAAVSLPWTARGAAVTAARAASLAGLAAVVVAGLLGPREPTRNLAVLVVWVAWWAGYTMTVYLVGDSWRALNPWRTLAAALPATRRLELPDRLRAWPSVAGLLALVWIEVVSPVADDPRVLVGVVLAYSAVTLAGAAAFGVDDWFGRVDPVARVFRYYGRVAPVRRTADGFELGLPGPARTDPVADRSEVAFVVALLWVTTYDGFVSTATGAALADAAVAAGVPPLAWYLAVLVAGFLVFLAAYRLASAAARRTATSFVATREIERRFVSSLLPIAAGYHLAHFLGYVVTLAPALAAVAASPLAPPATVPTLATPAWFGAIAVTAVIVGHLVAVWVGHATAFDVFAGRLQPIRSQYPYVVIMICYTVTSLWIITQPYAAPPHL